MNSTRLEEPLAKVMKTGKVKQKIVRFYQDEVGDWVAVQRVAEAIQQRGLFP